MTSEKKLIPAAAVRGIATGMFMMAAFTMMWAGITFGSLNGKTVAYFLLFLFAVFAGAFIVNAISLFRIAKHYPKLTSEADIAERKKMGKWFGIIFGAEGLGIFIAVNVVINLGYADLSIPVIALVVGLHFYPMAKIFKRTIDYYLATWTTIVAIIAILLILNKVLAVNYADAFVGVSTAIATSSYGTYMMISGWKINKPEANEAKLSA